MRGWPRAEREALRRRIGADSGLGGGHGWERVAFGRDALPRVMADPQAGPTGFVERRAERWGQKNEGIFLPPSFCLRLRFLESRHDSSIAHWGQERRRLARSPGFSRLRVRPGPTRIPSVALPAKAGTPCGDGRAPSERLCGGGWAPMAGWAAVMTGGWAGGRLKSSRAGRRSPTGCPRPLQEQRRAEAGSPSSDG